MNVLLFLIRNPLADVAKVAEHCNCSPTRAHDLLAGLSQRGLAETADTLTYSLWRVAGSIRQRFPGLESNIDVRELLLELLRGHVDTGLPMRRIVEETGVTRSTAKRLLDQLNAENLVKLEGVGRSAKWGIRQ